MSSEEERLAKAKEKLLAMNKKVQHATVSNKQRLMGKQNGSRSPRYQNPENHVISPRMQEQQQRQQKQSDYFFQLTESMIGQGFTEEEVSKYTIKLEQMLKSNDLEAKEAKAKKDIKKINAAINDLERKKDSKPSNTYTRLKQHQLQQLDFTEDDFIKPAPFVEDETFLKSIEHSTEAPQSSRSQQQQIQAPLPSLKPLPGYSDMSRNRNGAQSNNSQHNVLIPGKSPRIVNPHVHGKRISKIPTKNTQKLVV